MNMITDRSLPKDIIFFSLLFLLLPFSLITGPAIPDILLSSIAIYFLFVSLKKKYWHYYKNPIFLGFILFSFYGILRSIFSEYPIVSLTNEGSLFYFRYIFFAMGVWYLLDNNPYLSKNLLIIIFICIAIVCFDGLYQYFVGHNLLNNPKYNSSRLTGLFGDEPIIGRYIAYLSIFAFGLLYSNFKFSKTIFMISMIFIITSIVTVFLTGERAAFFYLIFFLILVFVFAPKYRLTQILILISCFFVIFTSIQFNPVAKTRIIDLTIKQVSETKLPFLPYSEHHEQHYISAIRMFKDQPIFGLGTNTFRYQCIKEKYIYKDKSCSSHPHHYYIQSLAELGAIGFLFIASFFIYISYFLTKQLISMIRSKKEKLIPFENFSFTLILFTYWWPLIPHMSLYNNWNNVLMMLPLGFFMRYLYSTK